MPEAVAIDDPGQPAAPLADSGPDQDQAFWDLLKPEAIKPLWHQIEPVLRRSVEWSPEMQKLETIRAIREKCERDTYKCWICIRNGQVIGVLITQVVKHSSCLVLDLHYGAGDDVLKEMKALLDLVIADLRGAGIRFIRMIGRESWGRAMAAEGFNETARVFMKEL